MHRFTLILPILLGSVPANDLCHGADAKAARDASAPRGLRKNAPPREGRAVWEHAGTGAFPPWGGLAILVGYAVAINVIGAMLLTRRDA